MLTIKELFEQLQVINDQNQNPEYAHSYQYLPIIAKRGDGVEFNVNRLGSWRGVYAEPCLFADYTFEDDDMITSDIIMKELALAMMGGKYEGYKGGIFSYSENDTLHVEMSDSDCKCYQIKSLDLEAMNADEFNSFGCSKRIILVLEVVK